MTIERYVASSAAASRKSPLRISGVVGLRLGRRHVEQPPCAELPELFAHSAGERGIGLGAGRASD